MVKDGLSGSEGLDGVRLNISSDGNLLYVAGHYENSVAWYQCDPSTGALTYGGVLRMTMVEWMVWKVHRW